MTLTQWLVIATVILLSFLDLYLLATRGKDSTISRTLLLWSQQYPVIAFAVGYVFGHIFWPNR